MASISSCNVIRGIEEMYERKNMAAGERRGRDGTPSRPQ